MLHVITHMRLKHHLFLSASNTTAVDKMSYYMSYFCYMSMQRYVIAAGKKET